MAMLCEESEGKKSKLGGNIQLLKDASKHYESMSEVERDQFTEGVKSDIELSERQIGRKARQMFCHMQKMFVELEELGYKGFAITFCNDKYNVAGSESVLPTLSRQHLDYLYSLMFYGAPPPKFEFPKSTDTSVSVSDPSSSVAKVPPPSASSKIPLLSSVACVPRSLSAKAPSLSSRTTVSPSPSAAKIPPSSTCLSVSAVKVPTLLASKVLLSLVASAPSPAANFPPSAKSLPVVIFVDSSTESPSFSDASPTDSDVWLSDLSLYRLDLTS